jgi:organic radical activating enzyme
LAGIHQLLRIQWNLTDHCNFNCDYCPSILKSGNAPFPDPQLFARGFDQVYNHFDNFELSLIGGEPTSYEGLDMCFTKIGKKDFNKKIWLETNASREKSWWDKFGFIFDNVVISYHIHFLPVEHLLTVLEILQNNKVNFIIKLPITPENWDDVIKNKHSLEAKGFHPKIQLLYQNFTKGNNNYLSYNEEQIKFFYKDKNVSDDQITEQIEYQKIHRLNVYRGHMCWAGVDQLVIDKYGNIYRGWCEQGGSLGNIFYDEITWPKDPILCQRSLCANGFDLLARKSVNSWGRL